MHSTGINKKINLIATEEARKADRIPYQPQPGEAHRWSSVKMLPYLSDYVPRGWQFIEHEWFPARKVYTPGLVDVVIGGIVGKPALAEKRINPHIVTWVDIYTNHVPGAAFGIVRFGSLSDDVLIGLYLPEGVGEDELDALVRCHVCGKPAPTGRCPYSCHSW